MTKGTGSITLNAESKWNFSLADADAECQAEMDYQYASALLKLEAEGKEYIGSSGGAPTVSEREIHNYKEYKVSSTVVVNWKDSSQTNSNTPPSIISMPVSMAFENNFFNWSHHEKEIRDRFTDQWDYLVSSLDEHTNVLNESISVNNFGNIQRTNLGDEVHITGSILLNSNLSNDNINALFFSANAKYELNENERITLSYIAYVQAAIAIANIISDGFSLESPSTSIGNLPGLANIQLNEITNLLKGISSKLDDIEQAIKELPRKFAAELTKSRIQGYYEKTSGNMEEASAYLLINDLPSVLPIAMTGIGNCRTIWTALQSQAKGDPGFSAGTSLSPFFSQLAQTFTYSVRNNDIAQNRDACKSTTFLDIQILKDVRDEVNRSVDYMKNKLTQYQPQIAEFPRPDTRPNNGRAQRKMYYFDENNGNAFVSRGYMDIPNRNSVPEEYEGLCFSGGVLSSRIDSTLMIYERQRNGQIKLTRYYTNNRVKYPRTLNRLKQLTRAEAFRILMLKIEPGLDEVQKAYADKTVNLPANWC